MQRILLAGCLALIGAGCEQVQSPAPGPAPVAGAAAPGEPPPIPPLVAMAPPATPEAEIFAMLVDRRGDKPSLTDASIAARYYCSVHGKLSQFIARDQPPELLRQTMPSYDLVTFRCVAPPNDY